MNRWILAGFISALLFVSCTSQTELSQSDPMQTSNANDGGSVTACSYCFDHACGWEASECASDPGCAGWLSCSSSCPAEADGTPSVACLDDCPDPGSNMGHTLRDVLVGCLAASTDCCDASENDSPDIDGGLSGSGGSGGSGGGASYADGGDAQLAPACATEGCEACLLAIKEQKECAVGDQVCASTMSDCFLENEPEGPKHCWSYVTSYAQCAAGGPSPTVASCSHEVPSESVALTASGLACATAYCPQCIPDPQRGCVACQLDACPDEMAAVLSTLEAQELLWCRAACFEAEDAPACNQACFEKHEAGKAAVVELYVCTQGACKSACESNR